MDSSISTVLSPFYVKAVAGLVLFGLLYARRARIRQQRTDDSQSIPSSPVAEKEDLQASQRRASRIPGTSSTPFPLPDPLPDFSLETARTRDYLYVNKTLRYPYYQTMAHQPMAPNDWIELSSSYRWYLSEKKKVIEKHGKKVVDSLPENDAACGELLEMVVEFMTARYPTLFDRLLETTEDGKELDGIYSHVTEERHQWAKGCPPEGVEGLKVISRLTENDFSMAREREDGHIYFVGGLLAFPGSYFLSDKIGKPMSEVHQSVPHFNQKLLVSVERALKRLEPNAPFERASWDIADDNNLFSHHIAQLADGEQISIDPGDLYLCIDRQAFRKLPRTKVIAFTAHPIIKKMRDLRQDSPLVPALLAKIHDESPKDLIGYKHPSAYYPALRPWLEEATKDQIARGLIKGDEEPQNFRDIPRPALVPPVTIP